MPIQYFKPNILIDTRCDHCGARQKETLARLYADDRLICRACGQEHTAERDALRAHVDETEALVARVPKWTERLQHWFVEK